MTSGSLRGQLDARLEPLRDILEDSLASGAECGLSLAVDVDGQTVADVWGGFADEARTRPWERDTIVNVWSTTKTVTSLAVLMLADRGLVDLDAPVARYWPEFAAEGKEGVLVRHLMSHTAGVAGWNPPFAVPDLYDLERSTAALAAQAPWWAPGTASGYHALTFGHLLGEVVRRVAGKSLTRFVDEEIAGPLDADFRIGAREADWGRCAEVIPPPPLPFDLASLDPDSVLVKVATGPVADATAPNSPGWRLAEIGAANGHGNALRRPRHVGARTRRHKRQHWSRRAAAVARDDRARVPRAGARDRPVPRRPDALRHRLRPARADRGSVRARGKDLLLGRLGRVDDHHGPGPPYDDLLHDEQDAARPGGLGQRRQVPHHHLQAARLTGRRRRGGRMHCRAGSGNVQT